MLPELCNHDEECYEKYYAACENNFFEEILETIFDTSSDVPGGLLIPDIDFEKIIGDFISQIDFSSHDPKIFEFTEFNSDYLNFDLNTFASDVKQQDSVINLILYFLKLAEGLKITESSYELVKFRVQTVK